MAMEARYCYDDFELIEYLSNRPDLSKGLEGASSRLSIDVK